MHPGELERGLEVGSGFGVDGVAGGRPGRGMLEAGVVEVVLRQGDGDRLLLRRLKPLVVHGDVQHLREHLCGRGHVCARQDFTDPDNVAGTGQTLQVLQAFEGGTGAVVLEEVAHFRVEGIGRDLLVEAVAISGRHRDIVRVRGHHQGTWRLDDTSLP